MGKVYSERGVVKGFSTPESSSTMARDCTMVHYLNAGRKSILLYFFEVLQRKSFGVLIFTFLKMSFKNFLDQMGSPSLGTFPD
jgi:hypothetical protein